MPLYFETAYVPVSSLTVSCGVLGIELREPGHDEQSPTFSLVSTFAADEYSQEAPDLGVGDFSPAARNLMDELCRHTIDWLEGRARDKQ